MKDKAFKRANLLLAPAYYLPWSIFLSFIIYLLNSSWMFNRYGWLDHFAYLGAAFYFPDINQQFPGSTIIELLPTYIPGAILYKILPPLSANFTRDIIFLSLSIFMFMRICYFLTKDSVITAIITLVMSSYYYFLASIGSDYTDSTIQILCITNLFFVTRALDPNDSLYCSKRVFFYLGVLTAIIFSAGVLSIIYIANFGLFITLFIYLNKNSMDLNFQKVLSFFASWILGNIVTIITISAYLYLIGHDYYMKQNILKLFSYLDGVFQNPNLTDWLPYSGWLILPLSVLVSSISYLTRHLRILLDRILEKHPSQNFDIVIKKTPALKLDVNSNNLNLINSENLTIQDMIIRKNIFILFLLTTSASMIFIQFVVKQWSLQFMYFSQINFIYFLGLAILISENFNTTTKFLKILLLIITAIATAYGLHLTTYQVINFELFMNLFPFKQGSLAPWISLVIFLTITLHAYALKKLSSIFVILSVLLINLTSYSQSYGGFCCLDAYPLKFFGRTGTTSQNVFNDTIELSLLLNNLDENRDKDVWFDDTELLGQVYRQVFSMNYFNHPENLINKILPKLDDYSGPRGSSGHEPTATRNIILMSEDLGKLSKAVDNLTIHLDRKIDYETHELKIGEVIIHIYITK